MEEHLKNPKIWTPKDIITSLEGDAFFDADTTPEGFVNQKTYNELKKEVERLLYHETTTLGLWATDKPDLIPDDKKEKFFEIQKIAIRKS